MGKTLWYSIEAQLDMSGMPNQDENNTFTVTLDEGRRCTIFGIGTILTAIYGKYGSTTVTSDSMDVSNRIQTAISGGNKLDIAVNDTTMGGNPYVVDPVLMDGRKTLYIKYTLATLPVVKIVRYYFSVFSDTNEITGFFSYDYIGANCYVSRVPAPFNYRSINVFVPTNREVFINFTDVRLQQFLGNDTPYFNIYGSNLYGEGMVYELGRWIQDSPTASSRLLTTYVRMDSLREPPRLPMHQSLYTDNARVYYKPHSLSASGGGDGVRNSRYKQRRT